MSRSNSRPSSARRCSGYASPARRSAPSGPISRASGATIARRGAAAPQRGAAQAPLPLRAEPKAKVDAYRALVDPRGETPGGYCLGTGMPGSMLGSGGYPMEIVQHENLILVVYEAHAEIRRIYLGERANPEDLFPDRNGYSFGRWEGDKLIVETTHLKEAVDQGRYPHSEHAKVVEEYSLEVTDDGTKVLTSKMTMTDPDVLHADDHGREEVAAPARRAVVAVRVQRAAVGRAPRAVAARQDEPG